MLTKLQGDHLEILSVAAMLAQLTASEMPADLNMLSQCRWRLRRILLAHLALEDRYVYNRVGSDPALAAIAPAPREKAALTALVDEFRQHFELWTIEQVTRDWMGYRWEVQGLVERLRARIDWEDRTLYPALDRARQARVTQVGA